MDMRSLKKYFVFLSLIFFSAALAMPKGKVTPETLYETARFGSDKEIAKALIRGRRLINGKFGEDGDSLLMAALKVGRNFKTIKTIINFYVDVDLTNDYGDTALIYAVKYDADEKTLKEIIECNATTKKAMKERVSVKNDSGLTAIDFTEEGSEKEALLKKYGAKRTPPLEPEEEPAEEIIEESEEEFLEEESSSIVEGPELEIPPVEVIEETAEENVPDEEPEILEEIDLEIPQEDLLAQAETPKETPKNLRDVNKRTYLFEGLETFETYEPSAISPETIKNPDEKDKDGRALIQNASARDDEKTIKILLDSGANVNLADRDGWTALMYAARFSKKRETVASLIEAGAKPKAKNRFGANALEIAASYGESAEVLDELAKHFGKKELVQSFMAAVGMGRPREILEVFFNHGITANVIHKGKTPLMHAAITNTDTNCIEFLLEKGADKTFVTADRKDAYYFARQNPNLPRNDVFWSLNNSEK